MILTESAHDQFMSAILAAPDDDGPRLVYADFLMERGDPRGEFIKVQCEIFRITEKLKDGDAPGDLSNECGSKGCPCEDRKDLRRRERDLFVEYVAEWFPCDLICVNLTHGSACKLPIHGVTRRGFLDEIHCTRDAWIGTECERCGGGAFVHAPGPCPSCNGIGRVNARGPVVMRAAPTVRRVIVEGCDPHYVSTSGWTFSDYQLDSGLAFPASSVLPKILTPYMPKIGMETSLGVWWDWKTSEAAMADLSVAWIAWAKGEK